MASKNGYVEPPALGKDKKTINIVVETPRGCRNKFKFDPKLRAFRLGSVLPAGAAFPYDFGFVPQTKGDDGDPIDVLLLMDEAAFPGCIVAARLIGVIEGEQTEGGKMVRNDRLVAVAQDAHDYRDLNSVREMNENLLKELEHFFVSYNEARGRKFKFLGTRGPKPAYKLLAAAMNRGSRKARKHRMAK